MYIILGFIGGSVGLALSILIRYSLAIPGAVVSNSIVYTSLVTFHGLIMLFFMVMPILIGGFGNILVPLYLGINDMFLCRINLLSL
jgi:heme/copper-type cytochrome/quinol oxidase subunit 1